MGLLECQLAGGLCLRGKADPIEDLAELASVSC